MGGGFAGWVLFLAVAQGGASVQLRGDEVNALRAAVVYLGGGAAAGAIVGLCYPLVRWWIGAAVVGMLAAIPFALGIGLSLTDFGQSWEASDTFAVTFVVFGLGGGLGVIYREIFAKHV